jgi:predicted  nucleic acid-binding Zn-ribbon protein
LGGAALSTLVDAADEQTEWTDALLRQIDTLRAEGTAKYHQIQELTDRVEQLQRELKAERQKQFRRQAEQTGTESSTADGGQVPGASAGGASAGDSIHNY